MYLIKHRTRLIGHRVTFHVPETKIINRGKCFESLEVIKENSLKEQDLNQPMKNVWSIGQALP